VLPLLFLALRHGGRPVCECGAVQLGGGVEEGGVRHVLVLCSVFVQGALSIAKPRRRRRMIHHDDANFNKADRSRGTSPFYKGFESLPTLTRTPQNHSKDDQDTPCYDFKQSVQV
jgi:hypothetical protein